MSTSAPAENPLPETNIVVLGGLLAGDTVMDWLKPEAASIRMPAEQARTYLARERIFARDITDLLLGPSRVLWGVDLNAVSSETRHAVKRILGTLPEVLFCLFRACGQGKGSRARDNGP